MKISVICHTHTKRIGSIDAVIGMSTNQGIIASIGSKNITVKKSWGELEETTIACIYYEEAIKHGFPKVSNHDEEMKAAIEWLFTKGEIFWEEVGERVNPEVLKNVTVRAGYEFARSAQQVRAA